MIGRGRWPFCRGHRRRVHRPPPSPLAAAARGSCAAAAAAGVELAVSRLLRSPPHAHSARGRILTKPLAPQSASPPTSEDATRCGDKAAPPQYVAVQVGVCGVDGPLGLSPSRSHTGHNRNSLHVRSPCAARRGEG